MTIHMALHLGDDIDRLHMSRNEGLTRIEGCIDTSRQGLKTYEEILITAASNNIDNM